MRRFTKVASLLAAMSVLACSVAFANTIPGLPFNLVSDTDVTLISGDSTRATVADADEFASKDLGLRASSGDKSLLKFTALIVSSDFGAGVPRSAEIRLSNDFGMFSSGDIDTGAGAVSFDKILVRTTGTEIPMQFTVSVDPATVGRNADGTLSAQFGPLSMDSELHFGLAGGKEYSVVTGYTAVPPLAVNCTIGCGEFYFFSPHNRLVSKDAAMDKYDGSVTIADAKIKWIGSTAEKANYVQCCPEFRVAVSSDQSNNQIYSLSRDFVVARLSETPFLRVRVADANKISDDQDLSLVANDTLAASKDFRASYWSTSFFNTKGAVDVPEGKTYNMGVAYTTSPDCSQCEDRNCDNDYLPFVAVTNLGTQSVWVLDNFQNSKIAYNADNTLKSNSSWLCNIWGALCKYDDMMNLEGRLGGLVVNKDPNKLSNMYEFPCHLYPAFSDVWKGAGNMDFDYTARKAQGSDVITRIQGRLNVAWQGETLGTSSLCPSCVETGLWIYWPCDCSEEYYEEAMKGSATKLDLRFAKKSELTLGSFNQTIATGEYAAMDSVVSIDTGLVLSTDVVAGTKGNAVLTKLKWNLSAANLSDAGLLNLTSGQWWRTEMWNKMAIKLNGIKLDATNVTNVSANEMTAEELSFLTVVDGPQLALNATSTVDVSLYVFVVDSDQSAVKYYKTSKGNRFLVVYDGNLDGKFSLRGAVVKASGDAPVSEDFGLTASTLELNIAVEADKAKTLGTKNVPSGSVVVWTVVSDDIATISATSGDTITVTGVAVGSTTVHAAISGDANVSADCTITVKSVAPSGDSSGGGCNVGFAPALLLLLAPLAFLKK